MDTIALYKHRIDALMDILFGAGVSNPQTIIEQLNYLLFLRALSIKDDEAELLGITDESEKIFSGELTKYKWQSLMALNPEELYKTLEESYDVLQKTSHNKTVKLLFRNAHVKVSDKPTLRRVLHEIDTFAKELTMVAHEGNKDVFGDMYEYLLSKLASAGTNGQYRTPRHIIDFIVRVVDPKKNERILDPACGTGGFLVAAYRYIAAKYTSVNLTKAGSPRAMDQLSSDEKSFLFTHMFTGFDSDEDMIKFGMMNLHLHGLTRSHLVRQNTLTDTTGFKDQFDVILANPPFSGSLEKESVSEDLQMGTMATEILFLRFMLDRLSSKGKLGVVVPQGVVFGNTKAHVRIRELLLEKGLWCVVSLPAGVFNPYSGTVTTSILFVDKAIADKEGKVLFCRIENDGYDLGAQRTPIDKNDLPELLRSIEAFKAGKFIKSDKGVTIEIQKIIENTHAALSPEIFERINEEDELDESSRLNSMPLRSILSEIKRPIILKDDNLYKQLTIKLYGNGVGLRQMVTGSKIKTKRQFLAEKGDFIISKIDARNGAFGIVPADMDGAVVSQDFPTFTINKDLIDPDYLKKIINSKDFYDLCARSSLGTTNRKRLKVDLFLNNRIPVPSTEDQRKIHELVSESKKYQDKINQIDNEINIEIDRLWKI
jgi:type I restriction enzyme M protein